VSLRRAIAVHEASHTTCAYRTGLGWIPADNIVRAGEKRGVTECVFLSDEAEAISTLAGPVAMRFFFGADTGSADDYRQIEQLASKHGGKAWLDRCVARAVGYLHEPDTRSAILLLADALEANGILTGADVEELLGPHLKRWFPVSDKRKIKIVRHRTGQAKKASGNFLSPGEIKKFTPVKDGDRIVDYQDVTLEGYLSTFKNVTESDRDGDYVEPGAFRQTIPAFMKNPVLLVNHDHSVENLAGRFIELVEDQLGLWFRAELSNAPSDRMRHIRALVVEGHLRTTSMGGIFHYKDDGRGIFKVDLIEGSLVAIPSNPDAIFSVPRR
jgi:HK97 family phage prohead protease